MKQAREKCARLARARKREALMEALQLAQEAFQAGDIRAHYKFIRSIAPKTYRRKLCLKSEDGRLMSSEEECAALAKYASNLFATDEPDCGPASVIFT